MVIYLDNHASTFIDPLVLQVQIEAYEKFSGNPHSSYNLYGRLAMDAINSSADMILRVFSSCMEYGQVYFTSGATEANNLALIGTVEFYREFSNKDSIIISSIEHKSVQTVARVLSMRHGLELIEVPIFCDGRLDLDFLEDKISDRTVIVSIQGTNSEIGVEQDIMLINDMCKKRGVVFHSDMVQSVYMDIDEGATDLDLVSISSHKRYGPQGVGALLVNSFGMGGVKPLMFGGEQQNGVRPGTLPTALIVAFAKAIELCENNRVTESLRVKRLRDIFLCSLLDKSVDFTLNGSVEFRHAGNISITFDRIDALDLICRTENELAISTSSACTSADGTPSHVLRALGLSDAEIRRTIRLGIGRFNSEEDIRTASKIIASAINS